MNKISSTLPALIFALFLGQYTYAQIVYKPTYDRPVQVQIPDSDLQPNYSNSQSQTRQSQVQVFSTIAYYMDGAKLIKVPIRVEIRNMGKIYITQIYSQTATGGDWRNVNNPSPAEKCMSMNSNELEKNFMYKCRVVQPTVTTVYFDL